MKVLQTLPRMNVGGVERGVVDLAKYFRSKGVGYYVLSNGGSMVVELHKHGAIHVKMPVHKKSPLSLGLIPKIKRLLYEQNIDIAHGRSRVPGWLAFFATRGSNTHFVTTAHGVYKSRFFSEVMGWGKFVICPSRTVARHMKDNFGVPEDKIIIINRWVDIDQFGFMPYDKRKNSNTIVSIGRITPNKGYEYLIEAFKKIVRVNPYMNLKIIGSPDKSKMKYYNYLKSLINKNSLHFNVKFTGFRFDVGREMVDARLMVAPSVEDESFGRVLVESFACGVPVIATKVGGYSEVIDHGVDGLLVPPKSPEAIADAVISLLNDHNLAQNLSLNGRKKVEANYTLEKCAPLVSDVYDRTLSLKRIAVMKFSAFGDLILIVPTLKMLKKADANNHVTLVTLKKYAPLFASCPYVDSLVALDNNYKNFSTLRDTATRLRRSGLDYVVDLQNSRFSQLLSFLSFPRMSFGFSRKLGFLHTKRAQFPRHGEADPLSSQERITSILGLRFAEKKLCLWDTPARDISGLGLKRGVDYIGVNVAASVKWVTKNWPVENQVKFIELIHKSMPGKVVVLFGDNHCLAASAQIEGALKNKVINLCGKTDILDLVEAMKYLKAFVTPDTATLHLAQSLNIPTIALFGPTNPDGHVVSSQNLFIACARLACGNCYKPNCKDIRCMKEISPSDVLSLLKGAIG